MAARAALGVDNGAENIRYRLQQTAVQQDWDGLGWAVPSRATIHKILRQEGLVVPEPRKRPKSSYRRFSYARPRDCYQIDATVVALAGRTGQPAGKAVVFEVIDDHSRVLVASKAADAETADGAVAAIKAAFADFGVPAIVLSDNGSAFTSRHRAGATSRFTRTVTRAGARVIHSTPYHPQTCGKVERHHRTFKAWLADQDPPATLQQLQTLCDHYRHWYNTDRRHSAVGGPPQHAWDRAVNHGGPQHLPAQTDATVHPYKVSAIGVISVGGFLINIGKKRTGQTVTVIRDDNHVTVYAADGRPLGHLTINPDTSYQGQLKPAA